MKLREISKQVNIPQNKLKKVGDTFYALSLPSDLQFIRCFYG